MTNNKPSVTLDGRYSVTETARLLGVDRKTLYRWRQLGYIKTKVSRFSSRHYITGREIVKFFTLCN